VTLIILAVATMDRRRKAATYGKSFRKPITDSTFANDDFAHGAGPATWDVKWKLYGRKEEPAHCVQTTMIGTQVPKETSLTKKKASSSLRPGVMAKQTTRLESTKASGQDAPFSPKLTSVFDFPSSGDDGLETKAAADGMVRKRRKVISMKASVDSAIVYDDDSLQRHIAMESSGAGIQRISPLDRAAGGQQSPRPHRRKMQKGGPADLKYRGAAAKDRKPVQISVSLDGSGADSVPFSKHVTPVSVKKASAKARLPPHRVLKGNMSKAAVQPKAPERVHRQELTRPSDGEGEHVHPYQVDDLRPSTPPNRMRAVDVTSTPRQRELWSKLLVSDTRNASPGLDLPSLTLTDREHDAIQKQSVASVTGRRITQESGDAQRRPKRIIDTLYPLGRHDSCLDDDSDSESISSASTTRTASSETPRAHDATKIQASPSADGQCESTQACGYGSSLPTQSTAFPQTGGLKVTYAKQRSYLMETDLEDAEVFSMPSLPEPHEMKQTRRPGNGIVMPNSQSAKIHGDSFDGVQGSQGGAMRSIHELREAGGNVRLIGELEAILDDLNDTTASKSVCRSVLLDLVTKLQDPTTCRLIVDQELEPRFLSMMGSSHDLITNSLFAAGTLQLISKSTAVSLLSEVSRARIKDTLVSLLHSDQNLAHSAKLREYNMTKLAQQEYIKLCNSMLKSACWRTGKPPFLSCQVLALQCLEFLVRRTRETGSVIEIMSPNQVGQLVNASLPSPTSPQPPVPNIMVCIELTISILESCTISNAIENIAAAWAEDTVKRILNMLTLLATWSDEDCGILHTLTLRLYLNMTNNTPRLCEAFAKADIISALFDNVFLHFEHLSDHNLKDQRPMLLDKVILSLGCLINLAESSDTMRHLVMQDREGGISDLDKLLQLFMARRQGADEVCFPRLKMLLILTFVGLFRRRNHIKRGFWIRVRASQLPMYQPASQAARLQSAPGRHVKAFA